MYSSGWKTLKKWVRCVNKLKAHFFFQVPFFDKIEKIFFNKNEKNYSLNSTHDFKTKKKLRK